MRVRFAIIALALPFMVAFTWPANGRAASTTKTSAVTTAIRVRNDNWNTVDVFAWRDGQTVRLGMVDTGSASTFKLPRDFAEFGDVRLLVEPIGPLYGYLSNPVIFSPGQTIKLDVGPTLDLSTISVNG